MPLLGGGVIAQIFTMDLAAPDQANQLIARFDAACPAVGVIIDADLVKCRRVDAVEPVGRIGEL